MTLSNDWSLTYASLPLGDGTDYCLSLPIGGLGMAAYRTADGSRGDRDGDVAPGDKLEARVLTFPLTIDGVIDPETCPTDPGDARRAKWADANQKLQALLAAWKPIRTGPDGVLTLRIPGMPETEVIFYGRPRGVDADTSFTRGHIPVLLTFRAQDPFKYGAVVPGATETAGSFTVTNAGDAATERATVTIVGNGSAPVLTNHSDGDGSISFGTVLAGGDTRVLDLRSKTCVDGSGDDHYDELAAGLTWFSLQAGVNNITVAGATSVTIDHRPAWH